MYKKSFSLENRKENAVLASVHFIRFENVIKNIIPIFGNQLWTVALNVVVFNESTSNTMVPPVFHILRQVRATRWSHRSSIHASLFYLILFPKQRI